MKKQYFIIFSFVLIGSIVIAGLYIYAKPEKIYEKPNDPQITGGVIDEHGCLGQVGYSWCEIQQKCLSVWEGPCTADTPTSTPSTTTIMTEAEARVIAEQSCIKGGDSLASGYYNEGTKTWWFDANLNATKSGCNPACVVSEETSQAEINWRCTGALPPIDEF